MSWLGKKFPAPIAKPMAPFFIAVSELWADISWGLGIIVMYGVNSAATAMANSEEFKNDPRNPNAKTPKQADKH
ncbi:putative mitochondrial F1F0 ATP synthase subunit Atp18 [Sclerotinia borealis F-4128]|uniref:Putative mitochondrial F1F0 ATP synthase subunit Atp18 n=1 Tax=Sclerotinia borealis (strain F-4128) TaxID=1432307 RepID=W9CTK3_SCLBF|nr:putative mitochondrial F1F0 ATP synthase subunit Atp18 [Sclerotinia borealis F-4128]